jgi:uncharacterized protein YkwD
LAWNAQLILSSTRHSADMVKYNYASHTGLNGSTPGDRMIAAGYTLSWWGENIFTGPSSSSVQMAIDWWMGRPGHCANIMNPRFKDVGLACVKGTSANTWGSYWTMNLAQPG